MLNSRLMYALLTGHPTGDSVAETHTNHAVTVHAGGLNAERPFEVHHAYLYRGQPMTDVSYYRSRSGANRRARTLRQMFVEN